MPKRIIFILGLISALGMLAIIVVLSGMVINTTHIYQIRGYQTQAGDLSPIRNSGGKYNSKCQSDATLYIYIYIYNNLYGNLIYFIPPNFT